MQKIDGELKHVSNTDSDILRDCPIEFWKDVTRIGDNAFMWCNNITSITIPNSVTQIGEYAFGWSDDLKSIRVPIEIANIGPYAFPCYSTIIFSSLNRDYSVHAKMFIADEYTRYKDPKKNIRQIYLMSKNIPYCFASGDVNNEIFNNLHVYNEILKEYVDFNSINFSERKLHALICLGVGLGLFSNQTEKNKDLNGLIVETPISELAKKVIKNILNKIPFQIFSKYFEDLRIFQFSPNFLKYLSDNNNLREIIQHKNITTLQAIYYKCKAKDRMSETGRN